MITPFRTQIGDEIPLGALCSATNSKGTVVPTITPVSAVLGAYALGGASTATLTWTHTGSGSLVILSLIHI